MAIIKNKNFSRGRLADFTPSSGDTIESCNLSQMYPLTGITDVTGLTFRSCNLVNCSLPADAVVENCNTMQANLCGHLNDDYSCPVDCEHLVGSEEIYIDGVLVETIYEYEDKVT